MHASQEIIKARKAALPFRTRMIHQKRPGYARSKRGAMEIFNVEYQDPATGEWHIHSQYLSRGAANTFRHRCEQEVRAGRVPNDMPAGFKGVNLP